MEQLTKNQAVATSQEAVQNQNEPQLRDEDRKSGSAGMPRPISYAVFCLKKNSGIRVEETRQFSRHLHGQRIVRIEPRIPITSFGAPCKRCGKFVLIAHVEKRHLGVRTFDATRAPIDPFALFLFLNVPPTTDLYPLSLHDALPI